MEDMPTFLGLPQEVRHMILSTLEEDDFENARRVCKTLHSDLPIRSMSICPTRCDRERVEAVAKQTPPPGRITIFPGTLAELTFSEYGERICASGSRDEFLSWCMRHDVDWIKSEEKTEEQWVANRWAAYRAYKDSEEVRAHLRHDLILIDA